MGVPHAPGKGSVGASVGLAVYARLSSSSAAAALRFAGLAAPALRSRFIGASVFFDRAAGTLSRKSFGRLRVSPLTAPLHSGFAAAVEPASACALTATPSTTSDFPLPAAAAGALLRALAAPEGLPKNEAMLRCLPAGPDPATIWLTARLSTAGAARTRCAPKQECSGRGRPSRCRRAGPAGTAALCPTRNSVQMPPLSAPSSAVVLQSCENSKDMDTAGVNSSDSGSDDNVTAHAERLDLRHYCLLGCATPCWT